MSLDGLPQYPLGGGHHIHCHGVVRLQFLGVLLELLAEGVLV